MEERSLRQRLIAGTPEEMENFTQSPENPTKRIFNRADVTRALLGEQNDKRLVVLRSLKRQAEFKPLACYPDDFINRLERLGKQFGNFNEVIEKCRNIFILGTLEPPNIINLPPLLLVGPPGVGKTRFISELASVLGTTFFDLDFSSLTSGFIISGGSSSWSDSKPGFVSDSIFKSVFANPIIMLDEIDKAQAGSSYDPLGSLYGLLERHTASRFTDEYLDIPMDLSSVLWVASANYPEKIPEPIRSRMVEVFIDMPTHDQSREIVKAVYKELLKAQPWGKHFSVELDSKIIELLSSLSARQVRIELENALARAAVRSQGKIRPIIITPKDVSLRHGKEIKTVKIGFLA